jgi:hypothetical protein
VNASPHRTGKHLHDRPPSFSGTFRLDGHIPTALTDRVVNAEASSHHTAADQEQRGESQNRFSQIVG